MFVLVRPIYQVLFTSEYLGGYVIAPYLFLAPLLQMLFQVACNQFLVVKKTWPNMLILSGGALANIAMLYFWKSVKTWFGFWTVTDELQCVAVKTMDD